MAGIIQYFVPFGWILGLLPEPFDRLIALWQVVVWCIVALFIAAIVSWLTDPRTFAKMAKKHNINTGRATIIATLMGLGILIGGYFYTGVIFLAGAYVVMYLLHAYRVKR